jgi:transcriptional regulator with XRE-family HTH domain
MFDLKGFRKVNKLTQVGAAKYFGVTQAFISQIEQGIRPIPDLFISKIKADENLIMSKGKDDFDSDSTPQTVTISKEAWDLIQKQAQIILSQQNDNSSMQRTIENLSIYAAGKQGIADSAHSARAEGGIL